MTIDWNQIKSDVADAMSASMVQTMSNDLAKFPTPSVQLAATYTWQGTNTVLCPDTSEVTTSPPSFIKLDSDANWYKVVGIDPDVSVTVSDIYSIGSYPSGATSSSKSISGLSNPPSEGSFNTKFGTPIAHAVIDGVKEALDQAEINDVASDGGNTVGPGVIV